MAESVNLQPEHVHIYKNNTKIYCSNKYCKMHFETFEINYRPKCTGIDAYMMRSWKQRLHNFNLMSCEDNKNVCGTGSNLGQR